MENTCKLRSIVTFITTFSQNKYVKRESSCELNQLACGAQFKLENQKSMTDSIDAEHEGLRIQMQYGLDVPHDNFHCKDKVLKYKAPVKEVQLVTSL